MTEEQKLMDQIIKYYMNDPRIQNYTKEKYKEFTLTGKIVFDPEELNTLLNEVINEKK